MSKSSPFEAVHKVLGANFAEYDGWKLPADYGDKSAEAEALAQGCAAFDLSSFGRIIIKGIHSEALMDRLLDGGADKCCEGKWIWSGLSEKSVSEAVILRVGKTGADFVIFTLPAQRKTVLISAQSLIDKTGPADVEISDITDNTAMLGIYGPEAVKRAESFLPFDIAAISPGCIEKVSLFMISATIIRGGWAGADGVEIVCPASVAQMAGQVVAKYHKKANITPAGMDCLKAVIANGRFNQ
ncbi:MAG TPA: hypothetical protein HPP87_11050 [Planctomycetes bacterium]|nr:hypothetical protein [Planctomycetota bacterium]